MFYDKLFKKEGCVMEKFLKKYGVIILLYFIIILGIILLNERLRLLQQNEAGLKAGLLEK